MRVTWMLLTALCLAAGPAFAADKPKKDPPKKQTAEEKLFARLDKNKDGKLSLDEYTANVKDKPVARQKLEAKFKRLDKDKDNMLTLEEFLAPDKGADD